MKKVAAVLLLGLLVGINWGCGGSEVWVEKYDNGKTKLEYEYYTDDKGNRVYAGFLREYFEGGTKKIEDHFEDGERNGKRIEYFENGKVRYEETFKKGKREGKRLEYAEDGTLQFERAFKDGTLQFERTFKDGKCTAGC